MTEIAKITPYGSPQLSNKERQRYRRIFKIDGHNSILFGVLIDQVCQAYSEVVQKNEVWLNGMAEPSGHTRRTVLFPSFSSLLSACGVLLGQINHSSSWAIGINKSLNVEEHQKFIVNEFKLFDIILKNLGDQRRLQRLSQITTLLVHTVTQEYHTLFAPSAIQLEETPAFASAMEKRIAWIALALKKKDQLFGSTKFNFDLTAQDLKLTLSNLKVWPTTPRAIFTHCIQAPPWCYGQMLELVDKDYRGFAAGAIWGPLKGALVEGFTHSLAYLVKGSRNVETQFEELVELCRGVDQFIFTRVVEEIPSGVLSLSWPVQDRKQLETLVKDQEADAELIRQSRPMSQKLLQLFSDQEPLVRALPLVHIVLRSLSDFGLRSLLDEQDLQLMKAAQGCSDQVKTWTMWTVWGRQFRFEALSVIRARIRKKFLDWFEDLERPAPLQEETRRIDHRVRHRSAPHRKKKESVPKTKPKEKKPVSSPPEREPVQSLLDDLPPTERLATERVQSVEKYVVSLDALHGYRLRLLLVQAREILHHDLDRHYEVDTCRRMLEVLLKALLPENVDDHLVHTHHLKDLLEAIVAQSNLAPNLLKGLKHYGPLFSMFSNANAALFYPDIVQDKVTQRLMEYIDSEGPANYLERTLGAMEELLRAHKNPNWEGDWLDEEIPEMHLSEIGIENEDVPVSSTSTSPPPEELAETALDAAKQCQLWLSVRRLANQCPMLARADTHLKSLVKRLEHSQRIERFTYTTWGELSLVRRLLKEVQVAVLLHRGLLTNELRLENNPLVLCGHIPEFSLVGLEWLAAVHRRVHYPRPREGNESQFREYLCQLADTALAGHGFTPAGGKSPEELISIVEREYLFPALCALLRLLRTGFPL